MPHLLSLIREDVATVIERDPAAKSRLEVFPVSYTHLLNSLIGYELPGA